MIPVAASLMLSAAVLTAAAPAPVAGENVRAFVVGLYGRYSRNPQPEYLGRDAPGVFAPELLRLIRRDQHRRPRGEAGTLDWDPVCGCQDADGLKLVGTTLQSHSSDRVTVTARLHFPDGNRRVVVLDLARNGGTWRVSDVHSREAKSLLALLAGPRT